MADVWLGITGSRKYPERALVTALIERIRPTTGVVSGACPDAPDRWAVDAARERNFETREIPADWNRHGQRAGFRRNVEIVAAATYVVGFWDRKSRGTRHTLALSLAAGNLHGAYDETGHFHHPLKVRSMIPASVLAAAADEWAAHQARIRLAASEITDGSIAQAPQQPMGHPHASVQTTARTKNQSRPSP